MIKTEKLFARKSNQEFVEISWIVFEKGRAFSALIFFNA